MSRFLLPLLLLCSLAVFAQQSPKPEKAKIAAIGFYNLENLFDTLDTPDVLDEEFTPNGANHWIGKYYWEKLERMADVISQLGTALTPDGVALLGVAEVENITVLQDLVKEDKLKDRKYRIVHYDSPDDRGIDVGLLYNPKYFDVVSSRSVKVDLTPLGGKDTRDILYVSGYFKGEPMHVMVGHWPSRRGGEEASEPFRKKAASVCKMLADSVRAIDPAAKIVVMGDLNDDPTNASITQVLMSKGKKSEVFENNFFSPFYEFYKKGLGTMAWRDAWGLFDQIMLSFQMVNDNGSGFRFYKAEVFNKKFLQQTSGNFRGYPFRTFVGSDYIGGYSDHFPVCVYLVKKEP